MTEADSDTKQPAADTATKQKPAPPKTQKMPPWKVLLHNDDVNSCEYVAHTIQELTPLGPMEALERMEEAHRKGVALVLTTHKERAELYRDQFTSKQLTVSIEADES